MDNYPEHLAPKLDEGGAVVTPFSEWWARVRTHFPTVPENVAEHWLHRHWRHSEYRWLQSRDYVFGLQPWRSEELLSVGTPWSDPGPKGSLMWGKHLSGIDFWLRNYMMKNEDFPEPVIVLDNRDGHLVSGKTTPVYSPGYPEHFILIEGHKRMALACHLVSEGRFKPKIMVWVMTHVAKSNSNSES